MVANGSLDSKRRLQQARAHTSKVLTEGTHGQGEAQGSSLTSSDGGKVCAPGGGSGSHGTFSEGPQEAMKETETGDMQERQGGAICHRDEADIAGKETIGAGMIAGRPMKLRTSGIRGHGRRSDVEVQGMCKARRRDGDKVSTVKALSGSHQRFQLRMPASTPEKVNPPVPEFVMFGLPGTLATGVHMVGSEAQELVAGGLMVSTLVATTSCVRQQGELKVSGNGQT